MLHDLPGDDLLGQLDLDEVCTCGQLCRCDPHTSSCGLHVYRYRTPRGIPKKDPLDGFSRHQGLEAIRERHREHMQGCVSTP